jgi:hypothetical protein
LGDPEKVVLNGPTRSVSLSVGRRQPQDEDSGSDGSDGSDRPDSVATVNGISISVTRTANGERVPSRVVFSNRGMADSKFQPGRSHSGSRAHSYRY